MTEAINPAGELYSGDRVREFLEGAVTTDATAAAVVSALRADVDAFGGRLELA